MDPEKQNIAPTLREMISNSRVFLTRQTKNYKVLLIYGFISGIFATGVGAGFGGGQYLPLYIVALGATPAMLGFLRSIDTAVYAGTSTPIGWMADKHNLKKLMLTGMVLQFFFSIILILAGEIGFYLWWAIPSRIIGAFSSALVMYSLTLILHKSLKGADRATGYSMRTTISQIPGLATPMLWALIVTTFGGLTVSGIRPLFIINIVGQAIAILWIYFKLDVPSSERLQSSTEKTSSLMKGLLNFFQGLGNTLKAGIGVKRWILACCFDIFAFSLIMDFPIIFAVEFKGANPYILGLMGTAVTVASLLLTIPMGRLCDKIGRKKVIYIGLPPMYGWIFLLVFAPSPIYLVASQISYGILMSTFPVWSIITLELVPEAYRGRYSGVKDFFSHVISIPASFVAGLIWTMLDPKILFLIALALESAAVILTKTIPETLEKEKKSDS